MRVAKVHAYGNDFLLVPAGESGAAGAVPGELSRRLCERHTGIGADGLILYEETAVGARMHLWNADGSPSELSGNGVRGLAAWLARERGLRVGDLVIGTDAGEKTLTLVDLLPVSRYVFMTRMGQPTDVEVRDLEVAGEVVRAVCLRVGNPQCVILDTLDPDRLARLGPALQRHPAFPAGVNVELAEVVAPDRVRILIWERGVGPTRSSGTGSCAAAVAAVVLGGTAREVTVEAPGGLQQVRWDEAGLQLTGWAEVLLDGRWVA